MASRALGAATAFSVRQTGLPATIEGAIRSGNAAAQLALERSGAA